MTIVIMRLSVFFSCLLLQVFSITPDGSTSPVRNWDASFTASSAQSSCLAMRYQDFMLLFLRSPSSDVWKPSPSTSKNPVDLFGLTVLPIDSSLVQFAPSWLSFPNTQVLAMTGLASDVEHLARIVQNQSDNHFNVYDESMTTHSMTERLAAVLQQAAQAKGGRPFGVQALLVGVDDIDPSRGLCIYSIDPSGSWQSWGSGAAIGKYGKQLRHEIAKKRMKAPGSLEEALSQLIECWIDTCKTENVNLETKEDYEALILQRNPDTDECCLYLVDEKKLHEIVLTQTTSAQSS